MVDDPSEYGGRAPLADPVMRNEAESELRRRREAWEQQRKAYEEAQGAGGEVVAEPGPEPTLEECAADLERERLFSLIEKLVQWGRTLPTRKFSSKHAMRFGRAGGGRAGITPDQPHAAELFNPEKLPAFHDPFAGGGSLPARSSTPGLEAYASDLNPVAVLINKGDDRDPAQVCRATAGQPRGAAHHSLFRREWKGAQGLAEDVRYYGKWMRDEGRKAHRPPYPKVKIAGTRPGAPGPEKV